MTLRETDTGETETLREMGWDGSRDPVTETLKEMQMENEGDRD